MKSKLILVLLCCVPWLSMAETAHYVSDDVYAYLHSGPSNKYRIIGTISAGQPVEELEKNTQTKYVKIRDSEGRTGWIEGKLVQSEESFRSQLPALEQALAETKSLLKSADQRHEQDVADKSRRLEEQAAQLKQAQGELNALRTEHAQLTHENQQLTSLMDDKEHQIRLDWLINGGIVAGIGALVGFLLPLIPLRRKRNSGRWMN